MDFIKRWRTSVKQDLNGAVKENAVKGQRRPINFFHLIRFSSEGECCIYFFIKLLKVNFAHFSLISVMMKAKTEDIVTNVVKTNQRPGYDEKYSRFSKSYNYRTLEHWTLKRLKV